MNVIRVQDLHIPQLQLYLERAETQLMHCNEPGPGIFIAESPNVITRALDAGYEPVSVLIEQDQMKGENEKLLQRCGNVPVYVAQHEMLSRITGYPMMRGFLCAMRRRTMPSAEEIIGRMPAACRLAILENVENPTNVGAIFRSAAAMNVDALILAGGCSDPLYRRAIRVSMGCVFQIPWTVISRKDAAWPSEFIGYLRKNGFISAALALDDHSVSIEEKRVCRAQKLALILGNEGYGLSRQTIEACDYTVKIPMAHGVDSLNVAAASAVAFWQSRIPG